MVQEAYATRDAFAAMPRWQDLQRLRDQLGLSPNRLEIRR
jgi:hypothetical protein